ncbi:MAG: DUF2075 domain-containing protein, partial [Sinobacteraceae bacterium]|nr:DUF2075 domain-containing protein [Nevskiaceae bacterium]
MQRAWFNNSIDAFLRETTESVVGTLALANPLETTHEQAGAWREQVEILRSSLAGLSGHVFLEFDIPRMGRRIDAVVVSGPVVFVIEFKSGAKLFERAAINQAWDYALDLKNFHETSHALKLIPVLVATEAVTSAPYRLEFAEDGVATPLESTAADLRVFIDCVIAVVVGDPVDADAWCVGNYRPTPTIVEAARALYARHSVEEISRNDAGSSNLRVTSRRVEELIDEARAQRRKVICFVTGVPGAGKTLVGLNVATRRDESSPTHAVFLSGNGPLVAVLRAALTRDDRERRRLARGKGRTAREANPIKSFIQNVHHFRDAALVDEVAPPVDHVAIFDEAQRAWNLAKTADFMKRRKGRPDFRYSEPEFLISYMDRHTDWAVIVCLVGGGQEIHTGEGGISEWLDAVSGSYPHWHLHVSSQLTDSEYAAGCAIDKARRHARAHLEHGLHLSVSMRSFRAENLSTFVKALLDREEVQARRSLADLRGRYPIYVTRDLDAAKRWVRSQARGSERLGLLASSKAARLKPHAIDVRVEADPVNWFLADAADIRSSQYLEDVATEFQVQGLELDWSIVNWDGDLRIVGSEWAYHDFRGRKWQRIKKIEHQGYLKNAYRVLLTRARQGMVIFVPPGDPADHTRPPSYYDPIYRYLTALGAASYIH